MENKILFQAQSRFLQNNRLLQKQYEDYAFFLIRKVLICDIYFPLLPFPFLFWHEVLLSL